MRSHRLVALVVAILVLAGCPAPSAEPEPAPPAPVVVDEEPTPEVQRNVRPGAFCSPAEAEGRTAGGARMRCTSAPGDDRDRWRRET